MHLVLIVTVFAILAGLMVSTTANDRPSDPFGDYTVDLYKDASLTKMWDALRGQMLIQKDYFHKCLRTKDCPSIPEIAKVLDGIRQYHGKALLGHLNLAVNLMIEPAPAVWISPLEAITLKRGDCKSYSIAKYAGVQELGITPDHVRLVIVHNRRHDEDHMVTAVYQDGEWFVLDNLTNVLVQDSERKEYEPLAVLDYKGVRRYLSVYWME